MSTGSVSWVLFQAQSLDIEKVHEILLDTGLSILRQPDKFAVWQENGSLLFITLACSELVRQESVQIGQDTPYAEDLSRCNVRIEIAFDDLQEVRMEAETLIEVQSSLQEATQGYIFNIWNQKIAPPPEYED
ncbi:MAG: hypothetical protein ABI947_17610 [Chloroflexota bacterium]